MFVLTFWCNVLAFCSGFGNTHRYGITRYGFISIEVGSGLGGIGGSGCSKKSELGELHDGSNEECDAASGAVELRRRPSAEAAAARAVVSRTSRSGKTLIRNVQNALFLHFKKMGSEGLS